MSLCLHGKALPRTPGQYAIRQREILELTWGVNMQIGEPLRTIVVEPLNPPVNEPQKRAEPIAPEPDPEEEPATK